MEILEGELNWEFHRMETRRTRLKRECDCGHVIDGSEPYRYQVGKLTNTPRLYERIDCEFCARDDNRY